MKFKRIIVVEDDKTTRRFVCHTVDRAGHCSIQCSTGRRAWEVLKDNPDISLIITDIEMPDMNGKELIQKIRTDEVFRDKPIIIISGVVGPNDIASILDMGASRFLPKPVDGAMLRQYIAALVPEDNESR